MLNLCEVESVKRVGDTSMAITVIKQKEKRKEKKNVMGILYVKTKVMIIFK